MRVLLKTAAAKTGYIPRSFKGIRKKKRTFISAHFMSSISYFFLPPHPESRSVDMKASCDGLAAVRLHLLLLFRLRG